MTAGRSTDSRTAQSPWQRALGTRYESLAPELRAYFGRIPEGQVGRGHGEFATVGTPRRWLWPLLGLLARDGILFPTWQRDVPFDVENTRVGGLLHARRTFALPTGSRVMVDEIAMTSGGLVDRLGYGRHLAARFEARVVDGALHLRSTEVGVRLGPLRIRVPAPLAPRVTLVERFDPGVGRQHVELLLTLPLIGRIYEYIGHFDYRLETA